MRGLPAGARCLWAVVPPADASAGAAWERAAGGSFGIWGFACWLASVCACPQRPLRGLCLRHSSNPLIVDLI